MDQGGWRGSRYSTGQRCSRQTQAVQGHEPVQESRASGNKNEVSNHILSVLKSLLVFGDVPFLDEQVIAGCLSEEEIMGLKQMFKGMDTDNSGTITLEELKKGLSKQGTKLSEYEVQQLMEAVRLLPFFLILISTLIANAFPISNGRQQADADGNGTIDYEEFITATMHMNRMDREEHLYTAFQYFDKDNSG